MANTHKDVEFHTTVFNKHVVDRKFSEACTRAVQASASTGHPILVDIVVFSRAGAKWWAGDYGVEEYEADPAASVFDRIRVTAASEGRVA